MTDLFHSLVHTAYHLVEEGTADELERDQSAFGGV